MPGSSAGSIIGYRGAPRWGPACESLLLPFLALPLAAQAVEPIGRDDRRDVVELLRGKPITGRGGEPLRSRGFGRWADSQLAGAPGRALPQPPAMTKERVRLVLEKRNYKLTLLLQRNVDDNYYDSITDYKDMDWAYAEAFVALLMADAGTGGNADKPLDYAYQFRQDVRRAPSFDAALPLSVHFHARTPSCPCDPI